MSKERSHAFHLDAQDLSERSREHLETALSASVETDAELALELLVVDEEEIRSLNARTRAIDRVTDVLSFPSMELTAGEPVRSEGRDDELDEEGRLFLGSVVICEKRAREQAEEYGHSYERELNYLAVHGAMHCLGYDHETEEQKRAMRAKEEEILNKMNLGREE